MESLELNIKSINGNINIPNFKTTNDVDLFKGIIGQSLAEKYIDMGLSINKKEYNIFISGHSSTGKTTYLMNKVAAFAKTLPTPDDWCYVYNFENENEPMAISLPAGQGKLFKRHIKDLINDLIKEMPLNYSTEDYEKNRNSIITKYQKFILELNDTLTINAEEKDLIIEEDEKDGLIFIPMKDKKEMEPEEYSKLTEEEKDIINENVSKLRLLSLDIMRQSKALQKEMNEELTALDNNIAENIISPKIEVLCKKYSYNATICKYIEALKKDVIKNLDYFLSEKDENVSNNSNVNAKLLEEYMDNAMVKKYEVNLLVDNEKTSGAPVIFEATNDYYDVFGKIEYENKMGNLMTDFTNIKAGNIHKANGGFLILNANDLIHYAATYENLIKTLKNKKLTVENIKGGIEITPIISLKAAPIPLNLKVILIGSDYVYSLFFNNDPDFQKLFKIKAEFDSEIEINKNSINQLIGYVANYINSRKFLPMTRDGIKEIIKYSTRLCSSKLYFSSSIGKLLDIVDISNYIAKKEKSEIIHRKHVMEALEEQIKMHSLVRTKILNMYKNKQFLIDTSGSKVGQINGLSVSDFGDIELGQAHRITSTTYAGRKGIINIEKESKMSGNIHTKSVMILSGYIGNLLGQETYLSFNANIVFEQLYSGIEGDSASCAELLCLLSSLSDIPLKQNLAITGSINQFGEVQPIGGVNEKIEGFFNICKTMGLKGNEGVIIPATNVEDLVLNSEVINAIKSKRFHIYSVSTIEQCMKLMLDTDEVSIDNIMSFVKERALSKLNHFNHVIRSQD
ncbi:lon-related putative ATP-dependent protease [Hathewaya proteolytica DSM 3090]|uniref:endopeptidase La n=1 Tax=Hathewaya proteolytica DSM 3090 TaxID=1121331 RepID=A0A1M6Q8U8_9CLOT|nr:ATP-binding protein [Hathewaya proteolytica]SHK16513.1 lon-related putative ATP-dependent protease [Hathewaya proteolytica DSM 3090]